MLSNVVLFALLYFTNITVCWGLCNLCRKVNVSTDQSSTYSYSRTKPKISLTANRAVNGEFLDHQRGDCAGTDVNKMHTQAWWNISLPDLAIIYKINLMFRENVTRHYGYYVFISKVEVKIKDLASLTPVYHEKNKEHPGVQNIIIFPGGIQGKQMYIYQNKSNPKNDNVADQKNNVLDICEVEIWGCMNHTAEVNCTCSKNETVTFVPQETLSSVVAWPHFPNNVTLKCHKGNVVLQNYTDQCEFKPKCDLKYRNQSILFFCSVCKEPAYSGDTVYEHNSRPFYSLNVGDNVRYTCKTGHRLVAGKLTRICQKNGSWSGEEPICKQCKCPCKRLASQKFIKDPLVLQERVEETKKILKVNRSELSAFKRKKISSYDGSASSTGIGMTLGVGVITFVIGAIVCCDLLTCRAKRRRRALRKALRKA